MAARGERWPPVYDLADLVGEIKRLTENESLEHNFFEWRLDRSMQHHEDICQGDVLVLDSEVPVILQDGQPGTVAHPESAWMVIGNTCDFHRTIQDAPWTQLVPIASAGLVGELTTTQLNASRRYTQARRFYVPPWSQATESRFTLRIC